MANSDDHDPAECDGCGITRAIDYQLQAARTLITAPTQPLTDAETMIIWNAIGLAGEAGEVVDHIKKAIFHRHGLDTAKVQEELGDLLWYVAGLCTQLGLSLDNVMDGNIKKLEQRYPGGFSVEDSKNRHNLTTFIS